MKNKKNKILLLHTLIAQYCQALKESPLSFTYDENSQDAKLLQRIKSTVLDIHNNINEQDKDGNTPLHILIDQYDPNSIQSFYRQPSPLLEKLFKGQQKANFFLEKLLIVAKILLENKNFYLGMNKVVNVNIKNKDNCSPFESLLKKFLFFPEIIRHSAYEMIKLFVKKKAYSPQLSYEASRLYNKRGIEEYCIFRNLMLQSGSAEFSEQGKSILLEQIMNNAKTEVIEKLLDFGANKVINKVNTSRTTCPLREAAILERQDLIKLLISKNAQIYIAIELSTKKNDTQTIKYLLSLMDENNLPLADINKPLSIFKDQRTLLAHFKDDVEMCYFLLQNGAIAITDKKCRELLNNKALFGIFEECINHAWTETPSDQQEHLLKSKKSQELDRISTAFLSKVQKEFIQACRQNNTLMLMKDFALIGEYFLQFLAAKTKTKKYKEESLQVQENPLEPNQESEQYHINLAGEQNLQ